jgi:hypothetical protein
MVANVTFKQYDTSLVGKGHKSHIRFDPQRRYILS